MKAALRVSLVCMLLLVFSATVWAAPIEGQWERTGDSNAGSIISIDKSGDSYRATLIQPTEGQKKFGFQSGDIVWINIKIISPNVYQGKATARYVDAPTKFFDMSLEMVDSNTFKYVLDSQVEITGRGKGTPVIFKRI